MRYLFIGKIKDVLHQIELEIEHQRKDGLSDTRASEKGRR